jgi:hypothetical protein
MEMSLEHARAKHNFSVDRVADLMGQSNKWVLYKWLENGRLPAVLIRPFENSCGIDLVTRYLGHSANKMLIDIPLGRKASGRELHELQASFAHASGLLVAFYGGDDLSEETESALTALIEDVAWHRANVKQHKQPSFDLEIGHE